MSLYRNEKFQSLF